MLPQTTPVPNALFDRYMPKLNSAELKLLLIIIRQTLGWKDERTKSERKERDWISGSQLIKKTGCSQRAIGQAIQTLINYNLIEVTDDKGSILRLPQDRRGKPRLYYKLTSANFADVHKEGITGENKSITYSTNAIFAEEIRKKVTILTQKMRITKETLTK